jgi:hypothetical protein
MPADASFSSEYAYFTSSIDLPQRFGEDLYQQYSWGQSDARVYYGSFQFGFGFQNIWLGPATQNPIILGNSAGGFPKIDFAFNKEYAKIGLVDIRVLWGRLSESDYFNNDFSDDHNLFSGIFFTYAPIFIPGFNLGLNRTKLSPWENNSFSDIISIFDPESDTKYGRDSAEQKASITAEWKYPGVGFRGYFEWARNDYSPTLRDNILLEPSHSQAFTLGVEQIVYNKNNKLIGLNGEITQLIHTRDYEIGLGMSQTGFYTHHIITQGYTNEGQILGAGIGPGAESQYFGVHYIFSKGSALVYFRRLSRNKDYIYGDSDRTTGDLLKLNVEITGGMRFLYFVNKKLHIETTINLSRNINWNYIENNDLTNFYISLSLIQFL